MLPQVYFFMDSFIRGVWFWCSDSRLLVLSFLLFCEFSEGVFLRLRGKQNVFKVLKFRAKRTVDHKQAVRQVDISPAPLRPQVIYSCTSGREIT